MMLMKRIGAAKMTRALGKSHAFIFLIGLSLSFCLPALHLLKPSILEYFDYKYYDELLLQGVDGAASNRIVIVDIDDKSLQAHGQWPWPRYKMAAILDRLAQAGAAVITLDMMFPEKDRTSLAVMQADLKRDLGLDVIFESSAAFPDNDRLMADAIAGHGVILGYQLLFGVSDGPGECWLHPLDIIPSQAADLLPYLWTASQVTCNLVRFSRATSYSGFFNASPDRDGILRSVPMVIAYNGRLYPSLALATAMKALRVKEVGLKSAVDQSLLSMGRTLVPLDASGRMLVKYRGKAQTFSYISAMDLLADHVPQAAIKDKIVLIGTSAAGLKEYRSTPTDPLFPGVEVHATVLDNLLKSDFIIRPTYAPGAEFIVALLSGILLVATMAKARALRSLLLVCAGGAALVALSYWLFRAKGLFLSPLSPLVVLVADFAVLSLLKFRREEIKTSAYTQELAMIQAALIESMASLTETRDPETGGHIKRTQEYVLLLARELRKSPKYGPLLTDETIDLLYKSAPLHDIGKVGVSDRILLKPRSLNTEEFEEMKKHTTIGRDVIAATRAKMGNKSFLDIAHEITFTHHERWDGKGYPQGLKGEQIPLPGRLMAIADMYDALTSRRVYKPAYSHEEAVYVMTHLKKDHFDPEILRVFAAIAEEFRKVARLYGEGGQ